MKLSAATFFCSILFISCEGIFWAPKLKEAIDAETKTVKPKKVKKNGLVKKFRDDGTIYSEVNYVNGVRHGTAKQYGETGKLLYEIQYEMGKKHGSSKTYYKSGQVRRNTEYEKGVMNGTRTNYFTDGSVSSTITYGVDRPGNDLREYFKSGKEITDFPQLEIDTYDDIRDNGKFIIRIAFSENPRRAEYYLGSLVNDMYFEEGIVLKLPKDKKGGFFEVEVPRGMEIRETITLIGKYKTNRGNPLIRSIDYDLWVRN